MRGSHSLLSFFFLFAIKYQESYGEHDKKNKEHDAVVKVFLACGGERSETKRLLSSARALSSKDEDPLLLKRSAQYQLKVSQRATYIAAVPHLLGVLLRGGVLFSLGSDDINRSYFVFVGTIVAAQCLYFDKFQLYYIHYRNVAQC